MTALLSRGIMGGLHMKRRKSMKKRACYFALAVIFGAALFANSAQTPDKKITVMNPRGIKPPIRKIPMATRPATLEGKTIYMVDTRYPRTREFVESLVKALKERYPKTEWVLKDKFGGYMDDDPKLWADAKENAHGVIMTIGH
jgi:hypothetical protein